MYISMLIYQHRFHGHGSLRFVYRNGKSIRTPSITLKYTPNPKRKHSRFAIVISKKVIKSAVGRNRLRRRIYEVIRLNLPNLKPSHDVVIMVFSSEVLNLDHKALQKQIRQIFTQAGLYK